MKYIPILMSTPMVQAILAGSKTMTRRIIKPQPSENWMQNVFSLCPSGIMFRSNGEQMFWLSDDKAAIDKDSEIKCPYGQPGDVLWVRETWRERNDPIGNKFYYKADDNGCLDLSGSWKPSIFMPKGACRIFLKVTSVRVERLLDISEQDARNEGVFNEFPAWHGTEHESTNEGKHFFRSLWMKINGDESWFANPWVWVISFERIEKSPSNKIEVAWEDNQK